MIEKGLDKIKWAEDNMSVLKKIRTDFRKNKPLKGKKIGMALHVEPKTAVLVKTLAKAGAKITITGCNPLSTQDDVSKALDSIKNINSLAKRGVNREEYYEKIDKVLDFEPQITVDDGGDLVFRIHSKRKDLIDKIIGGTEETTTGVNRLNSMDKEGELKYPMIAVNDTPMKRHFDNIHGTGESTLSSIMATTNLQISGKTFVVAGYGYCGRGVAQKAKSIGAKTIVTEVDPRKALEATMDGFQVMPMDEAIEKADFVVTTTGNKNIIRKKHLKKVKNGAVLANSGHFNVEIDLQSAKELAKETKEIREGVMEHKLESGKKFYILAEGRLVNLASPKGYGHPVEVMDLSFSLQALSIKHLVKNPNMKEGVYEVPTKIDEKVAELKLETMNIEIDDLTEQQKKYLSSWKTGT